MQSLDDGLFGPQLPGRFDFTLAFEHGILSIPPSVLFLFAAGYRLRTLIPGRSRRVSDHEGSTSGIPHGGGGGALYWSKTGLATTLLAAQLALLIQWSLLPLADNLPRRALALALTSSVVNLVSCLLLVPLISLSHTASPSPSLLPGSYLFLTLVLDLAQARSLFLRSSYNHLPPPLPVVFALSLATKAALVVAEELPKLPKSDPSAKRTGPESLSGVVNRTLFWWLNHLFLRGYRSLIAATDLDAIPARFNSDRLLKEISPLWDKRVGDGEKKEPGKHAFAMTVLGGFWVWIAAAVPPRLARTGFMYSQILLMKRVILFIEEAGRGAVVGEGEEGVKREDLARGLIGATVLVYVGIAVTECVHKQLIFRLVTMIRGAVTSMIYQKTVRLEDKSLGDAAPVTLMSTDMEGIAISIMFMHELWAGPIDVAIGMYLLYLEIGVACFLVMVPIVLSTAFTEKVAGRMGPAKRAWNQGVQVRVSATSSMLGQMKGIKMTGLSSFFSRHIQNLRDGEIAMSKTFRVVLIMMDIVADSVAHFTPVIVITCAVFWTNRSGNGGLPIAQAFTSVAIVSLVSEPLGQLLAARTLLEAALASFTRIQEFLLLGGRTDRRILADNKQPPTEKSSGPDAKVPITDKTEREKDSRGPRDGSPLAPKTGSISSTIIDIRSATLAVDTEKVLLRDVNLIVKEGSRHMITGAVGSGKSTVLKAIMGELKLHEGSIRVVGADSVAYCAQTPWLRNVTIRENIVAGTEFGFDAPWFSRIVQACALDRDFAEIENWDMNLVGSGGLTLSGGQKQRVALARAAYARKKLVLLDDVFTGLDHKTAAFVFQQLLGDEGIFKQGKQTVVLVNNQPHILSHADAVSTVESETLRTLEKPAALPNIEDEITSSGSSTPGSQDASATPTGEGARLAPEITDETHTDLKRQAGDTSLYKYYFKSVGWKLTTIFIVFNLFSAGVRSMSQVWLKIWTDHGTNNDTGLYYGIYVAFAVAAMLSTVGLMAFFYLIFIPKSGKQLHLVLLDTVLRAPLYFFTTVDAGVTLNRFSQDLTLIDQRLPMSFLVTAMLFLDVIAATAIIVIGAQYSAAMIPFIIGVLYLLQKFYLRTSRQMRFLDIETKSPLYALYTETLAGAVTVRAFGWEDVFLDEHQRRLDHSQKPYYLMLCLQRWLSVVLDLLTAGMAVAVVAFAVLFTGTSSSSAIGLAFLNIVSFSGNLMGLVHMWTQLEMSLGAIARVRDFVASTPRESASDDSPTPHPPPSGWPTAGAIAFNGVVASYSPDLEPALRGVTLTIPPGSKVAICGRTGSGKSSMLLTVLRLLDLRSGSVVIDGIDLAHLAHEDIRARIASLPQDPVTVPGTVRANLAPPRLSWSSSSLSLPLPSGEGHSHSPPSDADLITALQTARIWDIISSRGGLDADFDSLALSPGQRQLFCLAAAAVRKSKVVLLDEVTGSVDFETDAEVRRALLANEGFLGTCTVVEVVHRIEMVMEYDLVAVVDEGRVVEVGKPGDLLVEKSGGGRFAELWEGRKGTGGTGRNMSRED